MEEGDRPGHARLKRKQQQADRAQQTKKQPAATAEYRSRWEWLAEVAAHCFRGPALATAVAFALEPLYRAAAEWWPLAPIFFYVTGTVAVHSVMYWTVNGLFFCADRYGWLREHKLPRTGRMEPTKNLYKRTLTDALIDQLSLQPVGLYLILRFVTGTPLHTAPLGSVPAVYAWFLAAAAFNELLFYAVHRCFHAVPWLYASVHKKHHQYVGTVGFAAEHAHPVEHLLANDLPTAGLCLALGAHPLVWFVWLAWRLQHTYEAHSGYCFQRTWLGRLGLLSGEQAEFHDFHHSVNVGNYGHRLIDEAFRTMDDWLVAVQTSNVPKLRRKKGAPASQNVHAPGYMQDPEKISTFHHGYTCQDQY